MRCLTKLSLVPLEKVFQGNAIKQIKSEVASAIFRTSDNEVNYRSLERRVNISVNLSRSGTYQIIDQNNLRYKVPSLIRAASPQSIVFNHQSLLNNSFSSRDVQALTRIVSRQTLSETKARSRRRIFDTRYPSGFIKWLRAFLCCVFIVIAFE